jgi:hypothetical protein
MFYIIDSFTVIHEINMYYSYENIYDLNIQNILQFQESYDIGDLKETIDSLNKTDLDGQLKSISLLVNPPSINNNKNNRPDSNLLYKKEDSSNSLSGNEQENNNAKSKKDDVFKRLYVSKNIDSSSNKLNKSNSVQYFELINDNLLFVFYQKDGCCFLYKIDWNKRTTEESEEESKKAENIRHKGYPYSKEC